MHSLLPSSAYIKRMKHQCQYRGTRELDLIFRNFIHNLSPSNTIEWAVFDDLINENESDLTNWFIIQDNIPQKYQYLVKLICDNQQRNQDYDKI